MQPAHHGWYARCIPTIGSTKEINNIIMKTIIVKKQKLIDSQHRCMVYSNKSGHIFLVQVCNFVLFTFVTFLLHNIELIDDLQVAIDFCFPRECKIRIWTVERWHFHTKKFRDICQKSQERWSKTVCIADHINIGHVCNLRNVSDMHDAYPPSATKIITIKNWYIFTLF
jgi:Golgi nucleoside diphosphatase